MIFISHDITTVRTLADHVGVMYAGQWMEYGASEDVLKRPEHPYTQYLLQSLPKLYRDPLMKSIPAFRELSAERPSAGCPLTLRCPFADASCAQLKAAAPRTRHVHCVKPGVF
jgi:oligopeptide/dipeptide ABC transporter ATP-binding protein